MKLITILGQTSSGKSNLSIELAKYFKSQNLRVCIFGCDSRQVYKGLDIGTGKIKGSWNTSNKSFIFEEIEHYLIDYIDPKMHFNLQNYIDDFYNLCIELGDKIDIVILTGGTGLYAKTIIEKINLGSVKNENLDGYNLQKDSLQRLSSLELQFKIDKLGLVLNNSDYNNKIRLVSRLLKYYSKKNNWLIDSMYYNFEKQYSCAIEIEQSELKKKIKERLDIRLNQGLVREITNFKYLGESRFMSLGLEYRQTWLYISGKLTIDELQKNLLVENLQYAKRQLTWLKKQKNLIWIRNIDDIINNICL